MKQKRNLLIMTLLSGILGWTLGFLRLPYIDNDQSFWMGFIACITLVFLVVMILWVWNKNAFLLQLIGKDSTSKETQNPFRLHRLIWMLVGTFIVVGGLISSFLFFKQNEISKKNKIEQNEKLAQQFELMASTRKSNALVLINDVFDLVDEELRNHPQRMLSNATIERIVALNHSFQPYAYLKNDSLTTKKWSPERGQLLLMLSKLEMDSSSFSQIKSKTTFEGADLENINLSGANLSGVDLRNANLKNADLSHAILNEADLRSANLWGANLNHAQVRDADLKRVNMSWAELNEVRFDNSDLDDAILSSAKLRKANLSNSKLRWGNMDNAILNEANLTGMDLLATNLTQSNFEKANLSKVSLRWAILNDTNFNKANFTDIVELTKAGVKEKDWLEKLSAWKVTGVKEIQKTYKLVEDETSRANFQIEKKED